MISLSDLLQRLRCTRASCLLGVIFLALTTAACQSVEPAESPTVTIEPTHTPVATHAPSPTPDEGSPLQGTVRLWMSWNPQELSSLERVVRSFQEEYPGISFDIAYVPQGELLASFQEIANESAAPSLILGPPGWGPILWERGLLLELSERIDDELQEAIAPAAWSQVAYRGGVIGLPVERLGVLLYRNRQLADEAAATTQSWIERAQELRDKGSVGIALDYGFWFGASHIAACEGGLFDDSGAPSFQDEAGICWLNLLRDLRQVGRVTFNSDEDLDLFVNGEAAWLMDGTWNLERLRQELGDDRLVIDPWPVFSSTEAPLRGFVWTENVYLHPSGDVMNLESSWAFARFLMSPETQLLLADPQGAQHIPTLAEVELMEPYQVQAARALSEGVGLPLVPNLDLYEQPLEGAMRSVAIQGASPERALTVAVAKIEQALAELEVQP